MQDKDPRHLAQWVDQVEAVAKLSVALQRDGSADLGLGERRTGRRSNDLLPCIRRLQHQVFIVAVDRSGVEAEAGNLLETAGRDEDVKSSAGAAADLVAAVGAGQRQCQNLAILHQHHAGMDDGLAQRISDGSMHDGGFGRAAKENQPQHPKAKARSNRHGNLFSPRTRGANTSIDAAFRSDAQAGSTWAEQMVTPGRLELPTNSLGNCCSIHLSYGAPCLN